MKPIILNNLKRIACLVAGIGILLGLGGCKTTVKNYQEAYDVARQKRERDEERRRELQNDLGVDNAKLEQVDAPSIGTIELKDDASQTVINVKTAAIPFHREDKVRGVVIAVAKFKMPTNAESMAADLREDGFPEARMARGGEDFYVLIAEGTYPSDLAQTAFSFRRKLPEFPYVGIGEMLLVYPR
ncbi:MAG: hypothetical protein K2M31_01855 [Muribaculaceae bacterium]|nr:hypothetical protein [Muribaculaceae bacterium]